MDFSASFHWCVLRQDIRNVFTSQLLIYSYIVFLSSKFEWFYCFRWLCKIFVFTRVHSTLNTKLNETSFGCCLPRDLNKCQTFRKIISNKLKPKSTIQILCNWMFSKSQNTWLWIAPNASSYSILVHIKKKSDCESYICIAFRAIDLVYYLMINNIVEKVFPIFGLR